MQRLVNAVVSKIKNTAGLAAFAGTDRDGNVGPFWEVAPSETTFPYIVITNIGGLQNDQGYSTVYIGRAQLQFAIYGNNLDTVASNTETFCQTFDAISSLSLAGGEITRQPLRMEEPRFIHEPVDGSGERVYAGIVQYRFAVQRTRGS